MEIMESICGAGRGKILKLGLLKADSVYSSLGESPYSALQSGI